jgi:predicted amidophosphoribosyltransferase
MNNPNRGINTDTSYPDALFKQDHEPEGFCTTCQGFTTNFDKDGCCSECGTELVEEIPNSA